MESAELRHPTGQFINFEALCSVVASAVTVETVVTIEVRAMPLVTNADLVGHVQAFPLMPLPTIAIGVKDVVAAADPDTGVRVKETVGSNATFDVMRG